MSERFPVIGYALSAVLAAGLMTQPISFSGAPFGVSVDEAYAQGRSGDHANERSGERGGNGQGAENGTQGASGSSASSQGIASRSANGQGLGLFGEPPGQSGNAGTPNAIVRQFVIDNPELTQGEVASTLRSWNSLNQSLQAYLNNMDNPNSLPGLQISYVRENSNAQSALDSFMALGGDPNDPPSQEEFDAAQAVLDAQALLDDAVANPTSYTQDQIDAANATIANYTGEPPQEVVDQYNAWSVYEAAEELAQDAFMAASISYSGEYDEATLGEFRGYVDDIVEMKGLDDLVAEYDASGP